MMKKIRYALLAAAVVAAAGGALLVQAQQPAGAAEATLRKILGERIPQLGKVDEVTRSPMPGLYEIRVGTDIFYSDAEGNYLIQGNLIDTRAKRNLTEERQEKLMAVDFDTLPMKDSFSFVRGNGKRKVAIFEDPNCGYCKRFERELQKVDNVTVHVFLYPILGPDSLEKSKAIWCSSDKAKAWLDWMVRDQSPARGGSCDSAALTRNVEFGRKHRISGTPTMIMADGTRVPGAVSAAQFEKMLADASK
jgi:thiol:disulfide interchange protein DsbC